MRNREEPPCFEIVLTEQEYDELRKCLVMDPESERIVYGASYTQQGIILRANGEDLEEFAGYLAFDANHEESAKRQRILDRVIDRVEFVLGQWSPD